VSLEEASACLLGKFVRIIKDFPRFCKVSKK
jgi:hypothetical protein